MTETVELRIVGVAGLNSTWGGPARSLTRPCKWGLSLDSLEAAQPGIRVSRSINCARIVEYSDLEDHGGTLLGFLRC